MGEVEEAKAYMESHGIDLKNVVVHAPYIINLANTVKEEKYELDLDIHISGIPLIRKCRHGKNSPVNKNTKLDFAIPFRYLILLQ